MHWRPDRRQATGLHGTSAFPHEGSAGSLTGGGSLSGRRTGSVSPTRSLTPTQSWHAGASPLLIRSCLVDTSNHCSGMFTRSGGSSHQLMLWDRGVHDYGTDDDNHQEQGLGN